MEDLGESEDLQDTDIGAAAIGLSTTTAATLIRKTAWEQTILALQQLGVSSEFSHEVKQIIKIKHQLCLHHITLHWAGDRVRGTAGGRRVRHHGLGGVGSGLGLGQAERQSGQAESEGP